MLRSTTSLIRRLFVFALLLAGAPRTDAALHAEPWVLPAEKSASAQPDLVLAPDGSVLLSWIEKTPEAAESHRLRFARFATEAWSTPRDIARGSDWFVNWADIPHLLALRDGSLWAHWLRRNGTGVYDYGIALVHSRDEGATWSEPQRVEPEGAKLDYGFVSLWEQVDGRLGIAWLDARQKSPAAAHDGHGHGDHDGGAMMLRAATFAADGTRSAEQPLDVSTCDCCPTAIATTSRGPVLAYRGRTAEEIRDIRIVRFDGEHWSAPRSVHDDGWRMPGCPVNGPAIAAHGEAVAVAWYTEAPGAPTLRFAQSADGGERFGAPIDVASSAAVIGRAALAADATAVWLAWLEAEDDGQALWLARFAAGSRTEAERIRVARLDGRGSATGLPKLQLLEDTAFAIWTDVIDGSPRLRGARIIATGITTTK